MRSSVEHDHQVVLFRKIRALRDEPGFEDLNAIWATPNGGGRSSDAEASSMSREGVEPGVWDVCVATARAPYHGMFIELKAPGREFEATGRGEGRVLYRGVTDYQLCFGTTMAERGWKMEVCYHSDNAWEMIKAYLGLQPKLDASLRLRNIELRA